MPSRSDARSREPSSRRARTSLGLAATIALIVVAPGVAGQPLAFVALASAKRVAVIDVEAGRVVRSFGVPVSPHGIAVSADGARIFVPDLLGEKRVRILDSAGGQEVAQLSLEGPVHHLTRGGGRIYATLTSTGRLAIIDPVGMSAVSVEVGGAPDYALAAPDDDLVYVSDLAGSSLVVVDPAAGRVRGRIMVGGAAGHGALSPSRDVAYFTLPSVGAVAAIDLRGGRHVATVPAGTDPHGVAVGHAGRRLFVSDRAEGTVVVVDLATLAVERRIEVGDGPEHVTASPDGRQVLVAVPSDQAVVVIDAGRLEVTARLAVGGDPHQIAF